MRVALIGNCQVQSLAVVAGHMLHDATFRVFDYSQDYSRDDQNRLRFAEAIGDCDFIFAQTALLSHTNERDLRARHGSRVVTIANFYFRGLFPDSCFVGDFEHRLTEPTNGHSIIVLDAFRRGLTEAQAIGEFRIETLHRLGLLDAWRASMDEMHLREANRVLDVPGAEMMEQACRSYPAFLTMNHPTVPLLSDYLGRVFRMVDAPHSAINPLSFPDPLAHHDTTPVLDMVAEHNRLPYRTAQRWKVNSLDQRFIDLEEYVHAFYAAYRAAETRRLVVHSPTDIVQRMRGEPEHAFLVDPSAAPVLAPQPEPEERSDATVATGGLRHEMSAALAPLLSSIREVRLYTHRMHSFLEVNDPKVERLVGGLPKLDRIEQDVARLQSLQEQAAALRPAPPPPAPVSWPSRIRSRLPLNLKLLARRVRTRWLRRAS